MSIKFLIFVILMLLFVVLIVVGLFLILAAKNLAVRFVRSRQRCEGVNMADYLTGALGLFDATLRAMFGVPVFAFFLACFLMAAVFGLFLLMKNAAQGRNDRRRM